MRDAFWKFHRDNPHIYDKIVEISEGLWAAGWVRYSMRAIVHIVRWHYDVQTTGDEIVVDGEVVRLKISNNHSPYYARLIIKEHPKFDGFFVLKEAEGDV